MLNKIADLILKNRILFIVIIAVLTVFMAYQATRIELSYEFIRPLPKDDTTSMEYDNFKKLFGEDGSVLVVGIQDTAFFKLNKYNDWYELTNSLKSIEGIKDVLSVANLYNVIRNDSLSKFDIKPIINHKPNSQDELDSVKSVIDDLPFYKGLVLNAETGAHLMMVTFEKKDLNSKHRIDMVKDIITKANEFGAKHKLEVYFSGMPFIRTQYMVKVSEEMKLFLILAILITAIIVFAIFKSIRVVAYSMIVVVIGVVFSLGTLYLLGYKITVLTGLMPSIITVIALPNCVFIINKYQLEAAEHGDKMKAVYHSITKVALSNFLANITTSIGFAVFYFTKSSLLSDFGVVSAINVMATYFVALILIPIILSYSPLPKKRHSVHLTGKYINKTIDTIDYLVHNRRMTIYSVLAVLTIISFIGWNRIKLLGYVVDDLPKRDKIYTDLRFFEKNFHGVLPFEIAIDTKTADGVFANNAQTVYKINAMQRMISKYDEFSKPISIVEALRFTYQAYRDGDSKFYKTLPGLSELNNLKDYTSNLKGNENKFAAFMDSSKRYTRVSYQMADVGSIRMKELMKEIRPKIDSIFPKSEYQVSLTGNSLVFLRGNDFLFHHLFIALIIAIFLILLLGMLLFRSIAIIVLSKLPCLIPLAMTAGIMGFFNIPFKPSTIIIFTIAFGLSSDGTIYILAEYWNQLRKKTVNPISATIREVAISMIYTCAILFCGFAIFAASSFGGTVALGILMSITIAIALFTNLLMLPSILLSLENYKEKKRLKKLKVKS